MMSEPKQTYEQELFEAAKGVVEAIEVKMGAVLDRQDRRVLPYSLAQKLRELHRLVNMGANKN